MASIVDQVQIVLSESRLSRDNNESLNSALKISQILLADGCCSRCVLRFIGCTDFRLYEIVDTTLFQAFNQLYFEQFSNHLSPLAANYICTACLGSIQYAESYVDEVCEKLRKEDYQTDSICLSCTLPVSILPRDHLLKVHVNSVLNEHGLTDLVRIWTDINVRDPKDFFKHILGIQLKQKTALLLDLDAPLRMTVVVGHEPTSKEHLFLTELKKPLLKIKSIRQKKVRILTGDSRSNIVDALKKLDSQEAEEVTSIPPVKPTQMAELDQVDLLHVSTHVGGRYLKYSREYSQTPWEVRGQKLTEWSISDCFAEILRNYHRADSFKFVTAGREDANVRMLGTGRPFYFELVNPRIPRLSDEKYKEIELEINSQPLHKDNVQVRHLGFIRPEDCSIIKEGEETKTKQYRAFVWLSEPLTDDLIDRINKVGSKPFIVQQKTPVRVFQRRAALVRPKEIHTSTIARLYNNVDMNSLEARYGVLKLHTQAGTYIKEYVHGDLGRTLPNLASVGGIHSADLLELDVMDVDLVWPPVHVKEESEFEPMVIDSSSNKRGFKVI